MRLGRAVSALLILASGMVSAAANLVPAAAVVPPNPSAPCEVLPTAAESEKLTAYEQIPLSIRNKLNKRFEGSDKRDGFSGPVMAARDSDWSRPGNRVAGLAQRRFIQGGRFENRWYLWYVYSGGGSHTYHLVVANLIVPSGTAQLIDHLVTAGPLNDLCDLTTEFMRRPDSPSLMFRNDNLFW